MTPEQQELLDEVRRRQGFMVGSNKSALTHAERAREAMDAFLALDGTPPTDPPTEPEPPVDPPSTGGEFPNLPTDLPIVRDRVFDSVEDPDGWGSYEGRHQYQSIIEDPEHGPALRILMPEGYPETSSIRAYTVGMPKLKRGYIAMKFALGEGFARHPAGNKLMLNPRFGDQSANCIDGISKQADDGSYTTEMHGNGWGCELDLDEIVPARFRLGEVCIVEHAFDVDAGLWRSWFNGVPTHVSTNFQSTSPDPVEEGGDPVPPDGMGELVLTNHWGGAANPPIFTPSSWYTYLYRVIVAGLA